MKTIGWIKKSEEVVQSILSHEKICTVGKKCLKYDSINRKEGRMALFWVIVAAFSMVIELCTTALVSIWFSIGAVCAFLMALVGMPIWLQWIGFLLISWLMYSKCYGWLKEHFHPSASRDGARRLIGQIGTATSAIDGHNKGRVLVNGQDWQAQSVDGQTIAMHERIKVTDIHGVTLDVLKVPEDAEDPRP